MTLKIFCTLRYLLDTLDLTVPLGYLGPLQIFLVPLTFRDLLTTLCLYLKPKFYDAQPLGQGQFMVLMCLFVCLHVCMCNTFPSLFDNLAL